SGSVGMFWPLLLLGTFLKSRNQILPGLKDEIVLVFREAMHTSRMQMKRALARTLGILREAFDLDRNVSGVMDFNRCHRRLPRRIPRRPRPRPLPRRHHRIRRPEAPWMKAPASSWYRLARKPLRWSSREFRQSVLF